MNKVTTALKADMSWFSGNIIPISWSEYIRTEPTKTRPNGSTDSISMLILADIFYWYRPTEIRDESTGRVVKYKQKYKGDKLQKTYQSYAELFGVSKKRAKKSFDNLERLSLITREFRTIKTNSGLVLNNVMFVEPIIENIKIISSSIEISDSKKDTPSLPKEGGASLPNMQHPPHQKGRDKYREYNKDYNKDYDNDGSPPFSNFLPKNITLTRKRIAQLESLEQKHGIQYLKDHAEYTKKRCKTNFWGYFIKGCKEGWGDAVDDEQSIDKPKHPKHLEDGAVVIYGGKEYTIEAGGFMITEKGTYAPGQIASAIESGIITVASGRESG